MMQPQTLFAQQPSVILDLFIPGIPKPQPRGRSFAMKQGDKFVARNYIATTAEGWKSMVADAVRHLLPWQPLDCPVALEMEFFIPRPQCLLRKKDRDGPMPHTGQGDIDNYIKAVLDCLTQLGLWRDDRQVYRLQAAKYYVAKTGKPGMRIRVEAA